MLAVTTGALSGIRVLECGHLVSAAYATKLMADLGAEVIKIEEPGGDRARRRGPFPAHEPHPEKSGLYLYLNTNKFGVTLNLATPAGRALLHRLIEDCDILVHNYPPPQMAALGLDYAELRRINPRLVMTSISPFGLSGPHRDYAAHDLTMWSAGGPIVLNGEWAREDLPPLKLFGNQAGYIAGLNAMSGSLAALFARLRSGRGQHLDVSVQECLVGIIENSFATWPYEHRQVTRLSFRLNPRDAVACRDGYIYFLAIEPAQWDNAKALMGKPEWAESERFEDHVARSANWTELKPLVEAWVRDKSVQELYHAAQARRVPFAPVSTMGDLLNSNHLRARGFFAAIDHPQAGTLEHAGAPYRLAATPWQLRRPAPLLGQHNAEIFLNRLGLSEAAVAASQREAAHG